MTQGIYEFGPRRGNKAYGGSSIGIEARWQGHRRMLRNGKHHCAHLQNAWNLYGEAVFEFRILEIIEDPDERLAAEQKWLDGHHAAGTCYNAALDATAPMLGRKHTDKTKFKMGVSRAGKLNHMWGKHPTEGAKQKNREAHMGNQNALGHTVPDKVRHEQSERMMGHSPTEATRNKLRIAKMGNQNALGFKHTDKWRREKSEFMKRYQARKRAMTGLSLPVLLPNPSRPMLLWGGYRK